MSKSIIDEILEEKVIAIVRGAEASKCIDIVEALYKGGIRFVEITYNQSKPETWEETAATIGKLHDAFEGRVHIGAGTVTSVKLVEMTAKNHGEYIISPDTNVEVIKKTKELGMVSMPGALTPTEVLTAHRAGADFVKLFPIGNLGVSYAKAVMAPISHVKLLAVGGVNEKNVADFLKAGMVGAGIGGNLANKAWIEAGEFEKITETARLLVESVRV